MIYKADGFVFTQLAGLQPNALHSPSYCFQIIARENQTGSSLIEVLVALLILTIGILGMAAMQLSAKKLGYDTLQRSIAIAQAHDISERMRHNSSVIHAYVVNAIGDEDNLQPIPDMDCFKTPCSPKALAAFDLWEWEQALRGGSETNGGRVSGGLVNPRACITHTNGWVTIAIAWKASRNSGKPAPSTCGTGLNLYGNKDEERQVVFFTTFVKHGAI